MRGAGFVVATLAVAGPIALFIHRGAYQSHLQPSGSVLIVNRFTGKAYEVRHGLRRPVEDSTLENRVVKLFEKMYEEGSGVFAEPALIVPDPAKPAAVPNSSPFSAWYHNKYFQSLTPDTQFEILKRYVDFLTTPMGTRLIPESNRDKIWLMLVRELLSHPYARLLSEDERLKLEQYYRVRIYGRS